jgi:hypothetical protein
LAAAVFTVLPGFTGFARASDGSGPQAQALERELAELRAAHGESWRMVVDAHTGFARFLHGGSASSDFVPRTEAEWFALAEAQADATRALHGHDLDTLAADRAVFLPLGRVGSSDKMTVRFRQVARGVPVIGGSMNLLFDARDARLLSVDTTGLPGLSGFDVTPEVSARAALDVALGAFAAATGRPVTEVGAARLAIEQELAGKLRLPVLVWEVEVWSRTAGMPAGFAYRVSARGEPRVVSTRQLVHNDLSGNVKTLATPGTKPDTATNPETLQPAGYATVTLAGGQTTTTDANGNFAFAGINVATNATFRYRGTWADVLNSAGAEYTLVALLQPGVANNVTLNPGGADESITAQANGLVNLDRLHDFFKSVNPFDDTIDFQVLCNVNLADVCNAYYDGLSINHYASGGGCPNTGYDNVIDHELGHWLNDLYGSGNGGDGFGEGNADVFAMYANDTPIVGDEFFGPGTYVRNGENLTLFCGDTNPACYGEVHFDGEVLMGALWKVRQQLGTALGNAAGDALANALHNAWMNAYDDGQIKTIVETHWLTLDDDDGQIDNGTPHYASIDAGFKQQGFPGYALPPVIISGVTKLADTKDQAGPYCVLATLAPNLGATSVTSAQVLWRVGTGAFSAAPMTKDAGNAWHATIPGATSPADVSYYVSATNDLGLSATWPKAAPGELYAFFVGTKQVHYSESFDGPGDNGWTHQQIAVQDDWQHDAPTGKSGSSFGIGWSDPAAAYSGAKCWGNDLGLTIGSLFYNGAYKPDVDNVLRSPNINCGSVSGGILSYRRWLTVEEGIYDQATIRVEGATVWSNPAIGHVLDTSWTLHEIPVAAQVDGNPAVQLEWTLASDGGLELGGWTIDDVQILSKVASPATCVPASYGTGLAGQAGVPKLDSAGEQLKVGNGAFRIMLKSARANSVAYLGMGFAPTSIPLLGGTLLVVPALVYSLPTDACGQARLDLPIPADGSLANAGVHWQAFVLDAAAVQGFAITPGLSGVICP